MSLQTLSEDTPTLPAHGGESHPSPRLPPTQVIRLPPVPVLHVPHRLLYHLRRVGSLHEALCLLGWACQTPGRNPQVTEARHPTFCLNIPLLCGGYSCGQEGGGGLGAASMFNLFELQILCIQEGIRSAFQPLEDEAHL